MLLIGVIALCRTAAERRVRRAALCRWISNFFAGSRAVFGRERPDPCSGCLIHLLTIAQSGRSARRRLCAVARGRSGAFAVMVGVMLLPFSIGGWGLREFAMVSLFGNYGLTPEHALVFSCILGLPASLLRCPARAWLAFFIPRPERAVDVAA